MMKCLECLKNIDAKKSGIFAAGMLFGTAGIKLLTSDDAKKVYVKCTAAVLRAKDGIMDIVTDVQENAEDVYAEAQQINEERADFQEEMPEENDEVCDKA